MNPPDSHTIAVWTTLISVSKTLLDDFETALKNEGLPKLSWYDALLEIEKAGEDGIRPYALKERLLLPQYGTSRLLDKIQKAGLIRREEVEEDGRGQIIRLTQMGYDTRKAMWPVYARALIQSVEDRLTRAESEELERLLRKLAVTAG